MSKPIFAALFAATALAASSSAKAADDGVTVYCSILEEQCRDGALLFEKATGTKVQMIRRSTGETLAQIKAEAANPKGDVWWGGPAESHLQAAEEGLTSEYRSPAIADLRDWAKKLSEVSKGRATGIYLGVLGFGVNEQLIKARGLAAPKCWSDLLDPKLKDEVQMADPASSGTAYTLLATVVQLMGEDKGFDYLKSLHKNVSQYTKSGIAPIKALAMGETTVGVGFLHDIATQQLAGAPIKPVMPCEGTGYETGAISIVKGARNEAAAKKFVDWALGPEAQGINMRLKIFSIPSNPQVKVPDGAPDFSSAKLIDYDTVKYGGAAERVRLLKKFETDVKSAPR
jgi:iron(III) transport system substrate-binding protein